MGSSRFDFVGMSRSILLRERWGKVGIYRSFDAGIPQQNPVRLAVAVAPPCRSDLLGARIRRPRSLAYMLIDLSNRLCYYHTGRRSSATFCRRHVSRTCRLFLQRRVHLWVGPIAFTDIGHDEAHKPAKSGNRETRNYERECATNSASAFSTRKFSAPPANDGTRLRPSRALSRTAIGASSDLLADVKRSPCPRVSISVLCQPRWPPYWCAESPKASFQTAGRRPNCRSWWSLGYRERSRERP